MALKGIIFDMDGTVVDVNYDWTRIKSELKTEGKPILTYLSNLEEPERSEKWKILEMYEDEATLKAGLKQGMKEFLDWLAEKRVRRALVTNNSQKNVFYLLRKFRLKFDCIITRESGLWKPSGAPFLAVLKKLGLRKTECCVVGNSHFDVKAAEEAGILKIFILSEDEKRFASSRAILFRSVGELKERIKRLLEKSV